MKTKFTLLFVVAAISISQPNMLTAQVNAQDSLALVDLYNSTDGPHWLHHDNWLTTQPVQTWYGISIFLGGINKVAMIDLSSNNLSGNIPTSLGHLTAMYILYLNNNQLNGEIPDSLGMLTGLRDLFLQYNQLSGRIPSSLGNLFQLTDLRLDNNQLSDTIPSSLNNLKDLGVLYLNDNQLSGKIPSFNNAGYLFYLYLNDNKLTGSIPSISSPYLKELALNNNQLSGTLPSSFASNLTYLALDHNKLTGNIPPQLSNLPWLITLRLDSNRLTGSIPSSLGNLPSLKQLNLRFNKLEDSIPSSLGNLQQLQYLILSHNRLSGVIPSSFSNLKHLKKLNLTKNALSGALPAFLTNLPRLKKVFILHNYFTFDGMEVLVQHSFDTLQYYTEKRIDIHQTNNTLSVYAGGTLSNNTYKWFKDGALYATIAGDSTFQPTESGAYNVEVTNSIATELTLLSDTITYTAEIKRGFAASQLNSIDKTITLLLYPNPAKAHSTLVFTATGKYTIEVTDMNGKILQTKSATATKVQNTIDLNVSTYAPGIYLVTVIDEKHRRSIKLNKE